MTSPGHRKSLYGRVARREKLEGASWRDHLVMLLHFAAEIEHALMAQYLYAAYAMGGDGTPPEHRLTVEAWRRSVLSVAKEEMGHLLTVQNVLRLLGAPISLAREDPPWDRAYYPFPFRLEPLTRESLAFYVFAEAPPPRMLRDLPPDRLTPRLREFERSERAAIERIVRDRAGGEAHPVDVVYAEIIALISDEDRIPDRLFREDGYATQAGRDAWLRNHRPPPRMLTAEGDLDDSWTARRRAARSSGTCPDEAEPPGRRAANLLVRPVATRTEAVAALRIVAEQGEAPHLGADEDDEPSHFDRFLQIWFELRDVRAREPDFEPSRPAPTNPTTRSNGPAESRIDHPLTREWATLFNSRYRLLLGLLAHALRAERPAPPHAPDLPGLLVHKVFAEMYNVKALAERLFRMPLRDPADPNADPAATAGPPFEMPYDLVLPRDERDVWAAHLDLIESARALAGRLMETSDEDGRRWLATMREIDAGSAEWMRGVVAGLGGGVGRSAP